MIATSGFLTALECTKFDFGRSSAPDTAGEAYSAPPGGPGPLAGLTGRTSKGRGRKWTGKEGRGEREKGRGGTWNGGIEGKG